MRDAGGGWGLRAVKVIQFSLNQLIVTPAGREVLKVV